MRILYSHRIGSRDGQGVHLDSLVRALRGEGHEVRIVGPASFDRADLGGDDAAVAWLRRSLPAAATEAAELAYALLAARRLDRAAAEFAPDVIYERYNLFHLAGALVARRRGVPLLLEVNAPLADERARFGGLRLRRVARWAERFVWRRADRVLPVTDVLARHVAAAGVAADRITVVPNGIHLDEFPDAALKPNAERRPVRLGFVGFVRDWHGLDGVIRGIAAHRGPPLSLLVVGEGPARAGLAALAAELGVADRVSFTGLAARDAVPGLVASFDIALQPAAVPYASPLKVFEYMAAGRAIVAPDQPNLREVLQHGRTALLFDPDAPGSLWTAIETLARDAELRARLGGAARGDLIARDLTWEGNARRVAEIARHAARGAGRAPAFAPVAGAGRAA